MVPDLLQTLKLLFAAVISAGKQQPPKGGRIQENGLQSWKRLLQLSVFYYICEYTVSAAIKALLCLHAFWSVLTIIATAFVNYSV